ncbi:hypothetical protein ACFWGD_08320 [Corynebacterium sp. NPDC060344]|uniref:hypothetical protein n=1 Tax=Corynebacterium sp. NPDC060344 TaxID=3347101 RepID=UPI00365D6581
MRANRTMNTRPWSIGAFALGLYSVWLLVGQSANVVQAFAAPGFFGPCSTLAVSVYFVLLLVPNKHVVMAVLGAIATAIALGFAGAAAADLWRIASIEGVGRLGVDEWLPAVAAMVLSAGALFHAVLSGRSRPDDSHTS